MVSFLLYRSRRRQKARKEYTIALDLKDNDENTYQFIYICYIRKSTVKTINIKIRKKFVQKNKNVVVDEKIRALLQDFYAF